MGPNPTSPMYQTSFGNSKLYDGYEKVDGNQPQSMNVKLQTLGYNVIWKIRGINSISPVQRTGHFTASTDDGVYSIIGYGFDSENRVLNDIWVLNLIDATWRQVILRDNTVLPRASARAVLVDNNLWIFGGYMNNKYVTDLHVINLGTGQVARPITNGEQPEACSGHAFVYHNCKILLYGGFNGSPLNQCLILDLRTLTWKRLESSEHKYSCAYCMHNGVAYLYGGSSIPGLLKIDLETETITSVVCVGPHPSPSVYRATLAVVDRFLVFLGGFFPKQEENDFSPIRVFDTITEEWFVLIISHDSKTTSFRDGQIDSDGYFCLPFASEVSAVYTKRTCHLSLFLGSPYKDPPVLCVFDFSGALPVLNHQLDMRNAFRLMARASYH